MYTLQTYVKKMIFFFYHKRNHFQCPKGFAAGLCIYLNVKTELKEPNTRTKQYEQHK